MKYKHVYSYPICNTCNRQINIILINDKLIPVDIPPTSYKEFRDLTGEKEWLLGVDYSLKHKCDDSNYQKYYKDAIKASRWQR